MAERRTALSIAALIVGTALFAGPASAASATPMPTARGAVGVTLIGDEIYALGGADGYGGAGTKQVLEIYSLATGQWTQGAPLPDANGWGPGVVTDGSSLYAVGGWPSGGTLMRRYDPSSNTWTPLAAIPYPYTWGHAVVVVGTSIYAVGGSAMHRYDIGTDTWTPLAAPLYTSAGMGAVTDGSNIYLVLSSGVLEIYDIASNEWTLGTAAPASFDGPSAGLAEGKMFVFGGQTTTETDIVYGYELATGQWRRYAAGGQLWSWTGAAVADSVHVLGGFTPTGPSTDHLVFDPLSTPLPDDPRCEDDPTAQCGTDDDDDLQGTPEADVIFGGAGDDTISSGDGDDDLSGDAGNDEIDAGAGDDTADGGTGNDRLFMGAGIDLAKGGAGNDLLEMAEGLDRVNGGGGKDVIDGGAGLDDINGGAGFDTCYFSSRKEKRRMKSCEKKIKRAH